MARRLARKSLFYVMAAFIVSFIIEAIVYLKIASEPSLSFPQKVGLFLASFIISSAIVWVAVQQ